MPPLIDEYKWAIDLEVYVYPQEGLLNNPDTDEFRECFEMATQRAANLLRIEDYGVAVGKSE